MPEITTWTKLSYPVAARGALATKLFEAAAELGFDVSTIKAQSDGFKVPTEVAEYLWPSEYVDPNGPDVVPDVDPDVDLDNPDGVPVEPETEIPVPDVVNVPLPEPEPEPVAVAEEIVKTSSPRASRAPRK